MLLVDASQGIQAQTLANCYQAIENDLEIVAGAQQDRPAGGRPGALRARDRARARAAGRVDPAHLGQDRARGCPSCSTRSSPASRRRTGDASAPLRALIFDSSYDQYRGVVSSIRIVDGTLRPGARLRFMQAGAVHDVEEIGVRTPDALPVATLGPGEVGYLIAGIKDVGEARSGETVTTAVHGATAALAGYRDPKPMVFCGLYPVDGDELPDLRDALDKLKLNDAVFTFEPETSHALGIGFRCGFLGLLHMEIVRERLEREFDLSLIATAPSVAYRAFLTDGAELDVDNPTELPDASRIDHIDEPMLSATIITPSEYTGTVMELCQGRRAEMTRMEYLSPERVELVYTIPLAEVVIDFFDQLKSRTKGYASLDYEPEGYADGEPGPGRHPDQPHAGRRLLDHRAPGVGRRLRAQDGREAARAHPAAAVRRADPGGHRRAHRRPRDGQGQAQGRAGQVLRRRHHPQAQAAREAEGGQEADEEHRAGRGAPGGVHLGAAPG